MSSATNRSSVFGDSSQQSSTSQPRPAASSATNRSSVFGDSSQQSSSPAPQPRSAASATNRSSVFGDSSQQSPSPAPQPRPAASSIFGDNSQQPFNPAPQPRKVASPSVGDRSRPQVRKQQVSSVFSECKDAPSPFPENSRRSAGSSRPCTHGFSSENLPQPRSKRAADITPQLTSPKSTTQAMQSHFELGDDSSKNSTPTPALKVTSMGRPAVTKLMGPNERRASELKSTIVLGGTTPRVQQAPALDPVLDPRRGGIATKAAEFNSCSIDCLSPTNRPLTGKPPPEPKRPPSTPENTKRTKPLVEDCPESPKNDPRRRTNKVDPNPTNKSDELRSSVCLGGDLTASTLQPPPPETTEAEPAAAAEPAAPPSFTKKTRETGGAPDALQHFQQTESQIDFTIPAEAFIGADLVTQPQEWDGSADKFRAPSQAEGKIIGTRSKQSNPFNLPPSQKPIPIAVATALPKEKSFPWKNSARRQPTQPGASSALAGTITAPTASAADYKLTQRKVEPVSTAKTQPPLAMLKAPSSPADLRLQSMQGSVVLGGAGGEK